MMPNMNKNIDIVRNLFTIDVQDSARQLASKSIYLKLYWSAFGSLIYKSKKEEFTDEEKSYLLSTSLYLGYPLPKLIHMVIELFGENYLHNSHKAGALSSSAYDVFLLDYSLFLVQRLFSKYDLPNDFVNWALSCKEQNCIDEVPLPLLSIVSHRSSLDLQNQFDTSTRQGRLGLLGWTLRWKIAVLGNCKLPRYLINWLQKPSILSPLSQKVGITRLHDTMYCFFNKECSNWDLSDYNDALSFSGWMLLNIPGIAGFSLPKWSIRSLKKIELAYNREDVTILMLSIWHAKKIGMEFPINNILSLTEFLSEYEHHVSSISSYWGGLIENNRNKLSHNGVNIIGWPRTEIGIGEDSKCAALSFESVDFPFVIIDAANNVPPQPRQVDSEISKWIKKEYEYDIDIIYLDSITQYRYYAFELLNKKRIDRSIIAVSPWELPHWPADLKFVFDHVDFFWAASDYIKEAFTPILKDKVSVAKPAVVVPDEFFVEPSYSSSQPFRFITIFDGLSSIHRKNPFAVITAFKKAFYRRTDVNLIIKMMNLPKESNELKYLLRSISDDQRIQIITETLPQNELWNLVSSCHCFISLHRAEGFGRNIAEAMLLGRPVICSKFSGNLDFCNEDNSYLVDGMTIPVNPEHYSNSLNQYWFEASVDHAATHMKDVFDNYSNALHKAENARNFISKNHCYQSVGKHYVNLLNDSLRKK